jgi:16S rRNA (uracil1498-N3)-methyltransferase
MWSDKAMAHHIPRLLLEESWQHGGTVKLTDDEHIHHLKNVLRLKDGDDVRIFNATLGEWDAMIIEVGRHGITLKINGQRTPGPPSNAHAIHLVCALLKREAMELVAEKAAEIGVASLTPLLSEHTQRRPLNTERLQSIMVGAVEQCGGFAPPILREPITLHALLKNWDSSTPLYAAIETERESSPPFINGASAPSGAIGIIIGPEGGWSDDEVTLLKSHAAVRAMSLGHNVLRAETAVIVACGIATVAAMASE